MNPSAAPVPPLVPVVPATSAAPELLAFAAVVLALAAAACTGFGLRRERSRGFAWWVLALWLTTAGVLLAAIGAATGAAGQHRYGPLAAVLLMQWPVTTLLGMRLFHARQALPGQARHDVALLSLAIVATFAAAAAGGLAAQAVPVAASFGLHLYAAVLLFRGPSGRDATPLQVLGASFALVAFAPLFAALLAPATALAPLPSVPLSMRALAAALGATLMAFVALTLVGERSERQLRDSRRRLRTLANLDALTQVPNRRYFHELASFVLRTDPPGSAVLLTFDIDHFKAINDELGHAAGDRALTVVSGSVLEHLRSHDVPGRQGGDEFVLLLRRADTTAAMSVAARISVEVQRRAAAARLPVLSLSFGMVQVLADERIEDALRRADRAMYEAKRQGRGRAVAAEGDEDNPVFTESQRMGLSVL